MFKYGWDEKALRKSKLEVGDLVVYWPSGKIEAYANIPIEIMEKFVRKAYSWLAAKRLWERYYGEKSRI